jgi:pyridoxamine 5'-phosphate oxidase
MSRSRLAAHWRPLIDHSIARSRKVRGGNYVQLATVAADGAPRVRTVVQRGIVTLKGARPAFRFITDLRSQKVAQIEEDSRGEMCWWFAKSSEQYRVSGELVLVGDATEDEALRSLRLEQWTNLRDTAREQFYWAQPGLPLDEAGDDASAGAAALSASDDATAIPPPPPEFLLVLLLPQSVDYLRLTDNARCVFELGGDGNWSAVDVNP